jgi:hypothetical protein
MSNDNGFFGSLFSGLLGPSDEQLAEQRRKYGIADAEPPPGMSAATALPRHEAIMSMLGTSALYGGPNDVRRKYGILPDLLPWPCLRKSRIPSALRR